MLIMTIRALGSILGYSLLCNIFLSYILCVSTFAQEQLPSQVSAIATKDIEGRVALLNTILRHPNKATIEALSRFTGHHEQSHEAYFFMNRLTDGNVNLGEQFHPYWKKLNTHIENPKNRSVQLEHLRLSLLAYNHGRGKSPPNFMIVGIRATPCPNSYFPYCYKVDLKYLVAKSDGSSLELPATMLFYVTVAEPEPEVILDSLRVKNNEHLDWWR